MTNLEIISTDSEGTSPSESNFNLGWLAAGAHYLCTHSYGPLKDGLTYQFEAFSSDPLGDTRQYLFRELGDEGEFYAFELTPELPTPVWEDFLMPVQN